MGKHRRNFWPVQYLSHWLTQDEHLLSSTVFIIMKNTNFTFVDLWSSWFEIITWISKKRKVHGNGRPTHLYSTKPHLKVIIHVTWPTTPLLQRFFWNTVTVEAGSKPTSEIYLETHHELKRKEERIQVQRQHYPEICYEAATKLAWRNLWPD